MEFHPASGVIMVSRIFYSPHGWSIIVVSGVAHIFGEGMNLSSPIRFASFNLVDRSVHNVRIEQLWVDVTAQVGAYWAEFFIQLELQHGLDVNNINHIWLLQYLFLQVINNQLMFWASSWNQHKQQVQGGPTT